MPQSDIIRHLNQDARLAAIMPHIQLPEIDTHNDIYEDLLGSIIAQQLSVKAAATIENRFFDLFDNRRPAPLKILDLTTEQLRGVGLSNQKAGYIRNIAQYWLDTDGLNRDWLNMTDDAIIAELTQIKGVGKWTVQMILMFRLNRLDVFPIDDLGIRQGMIRLYDVQSTGKVLIQDLHKIAEVWRPYRSVACRYIWRWKDAPL